MSDIRNCKFEYRCHQRWDQLETVPGALRLRFCNRCQSAVHRADSEEEFQKLASQGRCVAVFSECESPIVGLPDISNYRADSEQGG
jgi:hypothetical protein